MELEYCPRCKRRVEFVTILQATGLENVCSECGEYTVDDYTKSAGLMTTRSDGALVETLRNSQAVG